MKDEDVDWDIYHRITLGEAETIDDLMRVAGYPEEVVLSSIARLVEYLLIRQDGRRLRPLGLEEMLLSCRIRYALDLPVTIEDGVIKMRPGE